MRSEDGSDAISVQALEPDQPKEYSHTKADIGQCKPDPPQGDEMERQQDAHGLDDLRMAARETAYPPPTAQQNVDTVDDEQAEPMPDAPDDEIPGHGMPEADQDHGAHLTHQHDEGVGQAKAALPEGAGEWIEVVGSKPLRQRDMPAVPEGYGGRLEIRSVQGLRQMHAHKARHAHGDVRVTAEVKVEAKRVSIEQDHGPARAVHLGAVARSKGDQRQAGSQD